MRLSVATLSMSQKSSLPQMVSGRARLEEGGAGMGRERASERNGGGSRCGMPETLVCGRNRSCLLYFTRAMRLPVAVDLYHIDKSKFKLPFVCGAKNLGEAMRRCQEGVRVHTD